uniref:Uncharacterized protein n=1 Tax=Salix viminalis TaxID=40686 RepID=A0A6N2LM33_SALVM
MEEDKASSPNASDIEMATNIMHKLDTKVRWMPLQRHGSESRRSECCIYRVPKPLRNVKSKAYDPLLISIGPLHHGNERLEAMEKEKLKYFKKLTERDGMDEKKMRDIMISIKNQEERLRHCYSEKSILMESIEFVEMILLDAVFIIQFFLESNDDKGPKNFEPRIAFDIREDLMLLENQLPLFIIQEIYDRVNPRSQDAKSIPFLDLATCHFRKYSFLERVETSPGVEGSTHFTDLLRNLMLHNARKRSNYIFNPSILKYSVVKLRKAGVKFQVTRDKCLVNITFNKGVLKIPQLEVDHNFERLVRNIMALERCCYPSEPYICSYIKFMDHLFDSAEDVDLLVQNKIIVHTLRDNATVSNMIKHFCENIFDNYTCFGDISQGLNAHYESPFNRALVYLPTLRSAATIMMILTFIQAVCSVISLL